MRRILKELNKLLFWGLNIFYHFYIVNIISNVAWCEDNRFLSKNILSFQDYSKNTISPTTILYIGVFGAEPVIKLSKAAL